MAALGVGDWKLVFCMCWNIHRDNKFIENLFLLFENVSKGCKITPQPPLVEGHPSRMSVTSDVYKFLSPYLLTAPGICIPPLFWGGSFNRKKRKKKNGRRNLKKKEEDGRKKKKKKDFVFAAPSSIFIFPYRPFWQFWGMSLNRPQSMQSQQTVLCPGIIRAPVFFFSFSMCLTSVCLPVNKSTRTWRVKLQQICIYNKVHCI